MGWELSPTREDGSPFYAEEVSYYTLYRNGEPIDYVTSTTYNLTHKGKCKTYTISVTDNNDIESQQSNALILCNQKKNHR